MLRSLAALLAAAVALGVDECMTGFPIDEKEASPQTALGASTATCALEAASSRQETVWRRILACGELGRHHAVGYPSDVSHVRNMAWNATQVKICSLGNSTDCVVSKPNTFPIKNLRNGVALSHKNGKPCGAACVAETWSGVRTAHLWAKCGSPRPWTNPTGADADSLFWACGNALGLHLSLADSSAGLCTWNWSDPRPGALEVFVNTVGQPPLYAPSLPLHAVPPQAVAKEVAKKFDADSVCGLSVRVSSKHILMEKPKGRDVVRGLPRGSMLVHAWYGNPGNRQQGKNVTAKAQQLLRQGSPLAADNALWGDPARNHEKVLVLCLADHTVAEEEEATKKFADSVCSLSARVSSKHILWEKPKGRDVMRGLPRGSMLVHAWYGSPGRRQQGKNVTTKAQQLLRQGSPLAANNALWGDPARNHEKVLVLCLEDHTVAEEEEMQSSPQEATQKFANSVCSLSARVSSNYILWEKPRGRDVMRGLPGGSMLVYAWYGNPGNRQQGKNVTAKAQQLLRQGSEIAASNNMWGDPARNHEKVLVLCVEHHAVAEEEVIKNFDADSVCRLSDRVSSKHILLAEGRAMQRRLPRGSILVHAWYGNPGNLQQGNNVTAKAQELLEQCSPLEASNALWGDPAQNHEKVLVLCLEDCSGPGGCKPVPPPPAGARGEDRGARVDKRGENVQEVRPESHATVSDEAAECQSWRSTLLFVAGVLVGAAWGTAAAGGEAPRTLGPILHGLQSGGGEGGAPPEGPVVHIYWDREGGCRVRRVIEVECPGVREEDVELEELANGVGIRMPLRPRPPLTGSAPRPWEGKFFVDPNEGRFEIASPEEITLEDGVLRVVLTKSPFSRKFKLSSHRGAAVASPRDSDADSDGVVSWSWSSSMDDASAQ